MIVIMKVATVYLKDQSKSSILKKTPYKAQLSFIRRFFIIFISTNSFYATDLVSSISGLVALTNLSKRPFTNL